MLEDQFDHLRPYEEKRIVQLATKFKESNDSVIIFQAENETVPYEFVKSVKYFFKFFKSPLYNAGYVKKFNIEELDIRSDIGAGELVRVFTYLASV